MSRRDGRLRSATAVLVAWSCVLAGSCGSGDDGGLGLGGHHSASIEGWLGRLPAGVSSSSHVTIQYGDLHRAARIAGTEVPDDVREDEAMADYYDVISGLGEERASAATLLPYGASDYPDWPPFETEQFMMVVGEGYTAELWGGDFDEDALTAEFGEPRDGWWHAEIVRPNPTSSRASVWLTHRDGSLLVRHQGVQSATDQPPDDYEGTLADDPTLVSLATALDDHNAYSAELRAPAVLPDWTDDPDMRDFCEEAEKLSEPPVSTATGIADDGGDPVFLVVLDHEDERAAESNAEALERIVEHGFDVLPRHEIEDGDPDVTWERGQLFREHYAIESIDVEDTLVVARLRPAESDQSARLWVFLGSSPLVQMWSC